MLASGFVPAGRLRVAGHGTRLGLFVVVVSTLAVTARRQPTPLRGPGGRQADHQHASLSP